MKIRICKADRGYYVKLLKDGEWETWLTNKTYDARERSYYNAYYATEREAHKAALKAKREEDEPCVEMEI